jgi:hypothetical protein
MFSLPCLPLPCLILHKQAYFADLASQLRVGPPLFLVGGGV